MYVFIFTDIVFIIRLLRVSVLGQKNTKHITALCIIVVSQKQRLVFHATMETRQAKGINISRSVKQLSDLLRTHILEYSCK